MRTHILLAICFMAVGLYQIIDSVKDNKQQDQIKAIELRLDSLEYIHKPDWKTKMKMAFPKEGADSANQILVTDGTGVLEWSHGGSGGKLIDEKDRGTITIDTLKLGVDGKRTKYKPGFTYYDDHGMKYTLLEWKDGGFGIYRWRTAIEFLDVKAEIWTDDGWIDIATHKAYLDMKQHKIIYYYE